MNAASDRLEDTFPHGTPTGYTQGCRGNACPAADEHGLSCKKAKQLAAGDYGYQKLAKRGLGPAEIALELGLIPEAPTATVIPAKKATASKPAPAKPAATEPIADQTPASAPARPSQKTIRDWAHANNIEVNQRGSVWKTVVDAYLAAHPNENTTTPTEQPTLPAAPHTVTDADLDEWAKTYPAAGITDQIDELRTRIDMPAPDPTPVDPHALADPTTDPDETTEVSTPGEFAARWNRLTDPERAAWLTSMRDAHAAAEHCTTDGHAALVTLRDTRPDWATVATDADLAAAIAQRDQARRFAEDSLAETAHVEAREAAGIAFVLEKWGAAAAERDRLRRRVDTLTNELDAVRNIEHDLTSAYAEIHDLTLNAQNYDALDAHYTLTAAALQNALAEVDRLRGVVERAAVKPWWRRKDRG